MIGRKFVNFLQRGPIGWELIKTEAVRIRIAVASERLDRTVAEMGQQHKADLSQGETAPAIGQSQPTAVEAPPRLHPDSKS